MSLLAFPLELSPGVPSEPAPQDASKGAAQRKINAINHRDFNRILIFPFLCRFTIRPQAGKHTRTKPPSIGSDGTPTAIVACPAWPIASDSLSIYTTGVANRFPDGGKQGVGGKREAPTGGARRRFRPTACEPDSTRPDRFPCRCGEAQIVSRGGLSGEAVVEGRAGWRCTDASLCSALPVIRGTE